MCKYGCDPAAAVAGLSMGGYGAWKLGLRAGSTFGAAASLSGALDIAGSIGRHTSRHDEKPLLFEGIFGDLTAVKGSDNDISALLKKNAKKKNKPRLYAWCGTEDFLYADNVKVWEDAKKLGYDLTCKESAGDHQWKYWDEWIQAVLKWWLNTDLDLE